MTQRQAAILKRREGESFHDMVARALQLFQANLAEKQAGYIESLTGPDAKRSTFVVNNVSLRDYKGRDINLRFRVKYDQQDTTPAKAEITPEAADVVVNLAVANPLAPAQIAALATQLTKKILPSQAENRQIFWHKPDGQVQKVTLVLRSTKNSRIYDQTTGDSMVVPTNQLYTKDGPLAPSPIQDPQVIPSGSIARRARLLLRREASHLQPIRNFFQAFELAKTHPAVEKHLRETIENVGGPAKGSLSDLYTWANAAAGEGPEGETRLTDEYNFLLHDSSLN